MNLIQQRQQLIEKRASAAHKEKTEKLNKLVEHIETVMRDPDVISVIEKHLVDTGLVQIHEFGCLCQDGFCSWQKGLTDRLKPLIQEWEAKGVQVSIGIDMVLRLPPSRAQTTIEGKCLRYYFRQQKVKVPPHLKLRKEL